MGALLSEFIRKITNERYFRNSTVFIFSAVQMYELSYILFQVLFFFFLEKFEVEERP